MKRTKVMSFTMSLALAVSSFAALNVSAAEGVEVSFGESKTFDAVRVTYSEALSADQTLTLGGKDYEIPAGTTATVVNVAEDTTASSLSLTDYTATSPEIKLLNYKKIAMNKTKTVPYLANSFCGGDNATQTNMGDVTANRYANLFDDDYTKMSALYRPVDATDKRADNGWYALNYNLGEATEIAKVIIYTGVSDRAISGYKIGRISSLDDVSASEISVSVSADEYRSSAITSNDKKYRYLESIVNVTSDKLQIKFDDYYRPENESESWGGNMVSLAALEFYSYVDVYTVGEETYTIDLENAPETFNAVRLSYDAAQNFSGSAQFLDENGKAVGAKSVVKFDNSTTATATLDTANVATKTAAKLEITVPSGVDEAPAVGAYLKYKRLENAVNVSGMHSEKGYEKDGKETVISAWDAGNPNFANVFDGTFDSNGNMTNTGVHCGWYHNASKVKDTNTSDNNAVDPEGIYKVYIPLNEKSEIAKMSVAAIANQITSYQVLAENYIGSKLDVSAVDAIASQNLPKKDGNDVTVKIADIPVNITASELVLKLSDFSNKNAGATEVAEIILYGYEEIENSVPAAYENKFVKNITPDSVDGVTTSATAIISTINTNDSVVKKITWSYGTKESSFEDNTISGNSDLMFGLVLDWGTSGIPGDFLNFEAGSSVDVINTVIE